MTGDLPSEQRQQRKLAYYHVLAQEEPDFGASLLDLYRRLDAMLAPFGRNAVRWELLDATHGGIPAEQVRAFRAIVAECEQQARAAAPDEASRWREQAELPRRFADILETVEEYRARWRLPEDSTIDVVDAYLSGEAQLIPPEPVRALGPPPFIRLQPPPPGYFLGDLSSEATAPEAPGAWVIPYDPAAPVGETRRDLETRLERLFAYLCEQASQEAERIEKELRDQGCVGLASSGDADTVAGARLLYLLAHRPGAAKLEDVSNRDLAKAWAADLGIALP